MPPEMRPQMNAIMLQETRPKMNANMIHETLPQINATTNAAKSADEHHHAPRDVPMIHETRPQMLHNR